MKLTEKEINIWESWQFFDKYGILPFEKKRINITISGRAIKKLEKESNKSELIENLILKN
jgi:hypothetical protein